MKKIRYILSALTLLMASATAHAQVFDITFSENGKFGFTLQSYTLITFSINQNGKSQVFMQSGADKIKKHDVTLEHNNRYGFVLTAVSTIAPGQDGGLPEGNFPAQAPKRTVETPTTAAEPALTGPALVLMRSDNAPAIYYVNATTPEVTLKLVAGKYIVNNSEVEGTVSAIYYVDPHQPVKHEAVAPTSTADGNIEYWYCARCNEGFRDEACTDKYAKNSWVRAMVSGTVTWSDADNQDGKRPESVTINLLRGGELTDKSATVTASDNWAFSFDALPRYDGESKITYSVSENKVTDYTTAVDGYNVTNTHTPETISISGVISWTDNDDFDGIRPESVNITLLNGGDEAEDITVTAEDNWAFSFTDLPKYSSGTPIEYSISAPEVEGYTAEKTDNDVTYTHTHTHTFVPVMDDENSSFTWTDYTAAVLNLECSNTECYETLSVDATITSEVTVVPTTEDEGVLTYTAKVIYDEVEYVSMAEVSIDKITAENTTTVTGNITPDNNSVTIIAATTESVTETHTVTAPTNGTANIVLAGGTEGAAANVNVSVPAGATINITSSGEGMTIIKGNINVAEGGTINISNTKVDGTVNGTINVNENTSIDITDATVTGKIKAAKATVLAGALEIGGLTVNEEGNQVAGSVNLADAVAASCPIEFIVPGDKVTVARQLAENVSGTMMLPCTVPVREISGAKIYSFGGVREDMSGVDMTMVTTGNLEAFKPYCIIPTADKITLLGDDATFPKTPSEMGTTTVGDWKFVAVNKKITWEAGDPALGTVYGFAGVTKNDIEAGTFVMAAAGAFVDAGRSILICSGGATGQNSGAKAINGSTSNELPSSIKVYFHNADETTGIAEINTETGEMSPVVWYDLNGRLIAEPTKGGIYIKGNKKVMVK